MNAIQEKGNEQMVEEKVGVLLAIDSPITRRGAYLIISREKDMEVVGEFGKDTFSMAEHFPSKTVLLRAIPARSDMRTMQQLREVSPEVSVVALAEYEDDESLFQAVAAGAYAFLTKQVTGEQLLNVLRRVSAGERLVCQNVANRPGVASRILERFRELSLLARGVQPLLAPLSSSEESVLLLIATGNPVDEVASSMNLSRQEVMNCLASALRKLELNERTNFAVRAIMTMQQ